MAIGIQKQSVQSLFIEMFFNDQKLSSGTAFIAISAHGPVLVTNRHNVTGRRQDNNQPISNTGGVPNKLSVWFNIKNELGSWGAVSFQLYDEADNPLWHEHPKLGARADMIALPVHPPADAELYPYDLSTPAKEILVRPAETVSVVGFPFGQSAGGLFPIWVSGFVASEPDVNYNDLPQFLVDCRTRPGQSGSPVIVVRNGMVHYKNGDMAMGGASASEFLGIYSGRINDQSDIGIVWKRQTVAELVNAIR